MVLVYERSRSIPYVHGAIFQFTSLKYGLCYRFQWSWGVMASQIITLKSSTTGLFCFQKFVLRARNVEGVSTPWRLMITYKRHRYMWNNIHLIRQIVCLRIPDNAIFWVVGLDQHGIYIYWHLEYWFMLSIIIAHANLQRMVAFYAHISQRAWTGHISFKLNIPLNSQPSTCFIGRIHV